MNHHLLSPKTHSTQTSEVTSPEITGFLNDLAGIGAAAYLDMRQADAPEYEDWRDGNFIADGSGGYLGHGGQAYTEDELERIHGLLLQEAWSPQVSRLFDAAAAEFYDVEDAE